MGFEGGKGVKMGRLGGRVVKRISGDGELRVPCAQGAEASAARSEWNMLHSTSHDVA